MRVVATIVLTAIVVAVLGMLNPLIASYTGELTTLQLASSAASYAAMKSAVMWMAIGKAVVFGSWLALITWLWYRPIRNAFNRCDK